VDGIPFHQVVYQEKEVDKAGPFRKRAGLKRLRPALAWFIGLVQISLVLGNSTYFLRARVGGGEAAGRGWFNSAKSGCSRASPASAGGVRPLIVRPDFGPRARNVRYAENGDG